MLGLYIYAFVHMQQRLHTYAHAHMAALCGCWTIPQFLELSLEVSGWEDLFELYNKGDFKVTSGGLGPLRVHHVYLTWVCMKGAIPWPSRYVHYHRQREYNFLYTLFETMSHHREREESLSHII
jgi:hypothetical protein